MHTKLFVTVVLSILPAIAAAQLPAAPLPDVSSLGLAAASVDGVALPYGRSEAEVVVRLVGAPLAAAVGPNAKKVGASLTRAQQRAYVQALRAKQAPIAARIAALGGTVRSRLAIASNAIVATVPVGRLADVAAIPGVAAVSPLRNYEIAGGFASDTAIYVGATNVWSTGNTGQGVRVAVLDSGIDYDHVNFGGPGLAAYQANDPNVVEPGTFPTAKVVGGHDFVGNDWPNLPLAPDPDPLDYGPGGGHGTHVADIIAGKNGVAPGALLYAVKVCSSVSTACSGEALLQGMDLALDPNGDGSIEDAVDVINMSLGSNYGQFEDDLSLASSVAVRLGVVVVAASGNAGDRPFITSSPASAPEVISVAQTQMPDAKLYRIVVGAVTAGGNWQTWSPAPVYVSGPLQYGDGAGGNLIGCNAFAPGSLAGKVVLVDRGTCNVSIKAANVSAGGGLAALIANNASQAPGDLPPDFSYGGGTVTVAAYTITRSDGLALRPLAGTTTTIDPANAAGLAGNMVASSARGPSVSYVAVKPEIGAPGATVSAVYGTGTGEAAFSGTSGATPVISGAAALLIEQHPALSPFDIKAMLVNNAETAIGINPVALPGYLAPISRIGGGEVRVAHANAATTTVVDGDTLAPTLSFGFTPVVGQATLTRKAVVKNFTAKAQTYQITPTYRYANDAASGAVRIGAPSSITVKANSSASFNVHLQIDAKKLPVWVLNGGPFGGDGYRLQDFEYDGYVTLASNAETVRIPWHVLPRRSATVEASPTSLALGGAATGTVTLTNGGSTDGLVDVFSLLGTSAHIPTPQWPSAGDNFAMIDLMAFGARLVGIGGGQYGIQFAIDTWGMRTVPAYPAEFDVYLDVNGDGVDDYVLYNAENGGFGVTGQDLVYVYNLHTGAAAAYYYVDADFLSGNMIFTAPLSVLGMTPGTKVNVSVYAFDNYFTGNLTDAIEGMTYTAGAPRWYVDNPSPVVPINGSLTLTVSTLPGGDVASPSQQGLLLLYRHQKYQSEAQSILVTP